MNKDHIEDFIDTLERQNAIRMLPSEERDVLSFVENMDMKMALQSKDLDEYFTLNEIATPIERAANHFNKSTDEVKQITLSAVQTVNEMLNKNDKT